MTITFVSLLFSFALAISKPRLPVDWQSETLVCKGAAFQTIEAMAIVENFIVLIDDQSAGIIVISSYYSEIDRDVYFQFVFRKSKEQPSKSFLAMSVRTLDATEIPNTVDQTLQSLQNELLLKAGPGKCS